MLHLHNLIDLNSLALNNEDLKVIKKDLDTNILYISFGKFNNDNFDTKIVNLTKNIINNDVFQLSEFNNNIKEANETFLNDLKNKVNELSINSHNNLSDLLLFLNKKTFYGTTFYLNQQNAGNNCPGGVPAGYGSPNCVLSYIACGKSKTNTNDEENEESNIDENDIVQSGIDFEKLKKIKLVLNKLINDKEKNEKILFIKKSIENYDLFKTTIQNIDLMNLNMLFNESEKKELLLDESKPLIIIWNIEGIRSEYNIENEVINIKNYFNSCVFNDFIENQNQVCKCCNRKLQELNEDEKFEKFTEYVNGSNDEKKINRFNLESFEEDLTLFVCTTCKNKIRDNNLILGNYKFVLLKDVETFFGNEQQIIKNNFYKNVVELINSNDKGYLYKIDKENDSYNFSYLFNFKSNKNLTYDQIRENYFTINKFLSNSNNLNEKSLFVNKFSFLANHFAIKGKILEIDKHFKEFMDFYLNGTKLSFKTYCYLLNILYLNKFNSTHNEKDFNIDTFKENYFNFFVKLTKKGEDNMGIKDCINNKLEQLEINNIQLDLTNEEVVVLAGRIYGYLNNKSEKEDKKLSYLSNIKSHHKNNLLRYLDNAFNLYGYKIGENQIKFRQSYGYVIENLKNVSLQMDELKHFFMIGALSTNNEIKLTKIGE